MTDMTSNRTMREFRLALVEQQTLINSTGLIYSFVFRYIGKSVSNIPSILVGCEDTYYHSYSKIVFSPVRDEFCRILSKLTALAISGNFCMYYISFDCH